MAETETQTKIWPVLLCGGTGTRLWPISRGLFPKQFMALTAESTMLQETARRLSGARFHAPLLLCNDEHRFLTAEQMRAVEIAPEAIVLEPVGRNTAPAAAVAAGVLAERDPSALMLLAPADHVIARPDALLAAIEAALPAAENGSVVTFGIVPTRPETGYGYIRRGDALEDATGCFTFDSFVEKPDAKTAQSYVASGEYFWNSGIFLVSAATYLDELARHSAAVATAAAKALAGAERDLDFLRLDAAALGESPSLSVDYAVMEYTDRGAVVPVDMGWSDVGSWDALWEVVDKDAAGNVTVGDVVAHDVQGSYLRSERQLLAVLGIRDVIVVATDDAVLVANRAAAQDVKTIVESMQAEGRAEHITHTTVYRPWGNFQGLDVGTAFQVKRITVKPGGRLSLQRHAQRAEHWVVVVGTATVTRGEEVFELAANESTYIPIGMAHRLENRADEPLHLIEVQSGDYLGEDDIERLDDVYGRD